MNRFFAAGLLAAFMVPAGAVHAWEPGPYLGFGLGGTSFDLDVEDYDDGTIEPGSGSVDSTDAGLKIFGGYRITPYLGVELYYANLGEAGFDGVSDAAEGSEVFWCAGNVDSSDKVDGMGLSILGNVPVGRDFNLYGKFGLFGYTYRARFNDSCGAFRDRETDNELAYGAGMSYHVDHRTAVHLEWERFPDILDSFDVDFFSLSLSFDLY